MHLLASLSAPFDLSHFVGILIILVIDLLIVLYCLEDLLKPDREVAGGNKALWAIILLFSGIGWILYLTVGRAHDSDQRPRRR